MTYAITVKNVFCELPFYMISFDEKSFPIWYIETVHSVDAPIFAAKFLCMFNIRLGSMVYNDIAATDAPCMRLGISWNGMSSPRMI